MEKKKKLIILGVIILILAISGLTYAILTWTSSKINIGLTSGCFTIDYTKGQDISGNLKLLNESDLISSNKFTIKNGIGISAVNIGIKSTCTIEGYGSIYLNVTNISEAFTTGDSKGALKYAVLSNTSTITTPSSVTVDSLLNQSFDIVSTGSITGSDTITLLTKQLSNTEVYKYLVVIYVDNALAGNDITSASFTGNISADAEQLAPTPDYCFTLSDKNENNKIAAIATNGYNCYEGNSNGYETITNINIPEKINGYTITSIKEGAFCKYNKGSNSSSCSDGVGLTAVIMPDTITTIGGLAFGKNKISMIKLSNSLTSFETVCSEYAYGRCRLNSGPFENNNITQVEIPNSVTEIGEGAFKYNKLTNITIPSSVTTIGSFAFSHNQLTSVTIPDSVTTIGDHAFQANKLINITIPDSITTIEGFAFYNNQLTSVTIPISVESIGRSAFAYNNLNYILINSGSKLTSIDYEAFSSSSRTDISNGITYVDNPNLKIYNNSGKAFDWNYAVNGTSGTTFVTGTTNTKGNYNAVTVTTGQPS